MLRTKEDSDEFSFFTIIGRGVAGDDCCSGIAIKSSHHHPRMYSLNASDFNALCPIIMPTHPTLALTEFFHADTVASVHPLPVS